MDKENNMINEGITLKPLISTTVTTSGIGAWLLSFLNIINPILGFIIIVFAVCFWYYKFKKEHTESKIKDLELAHKIEKYKRKP